MIRIHLVNEGRVVKQISSRLHEGIILEQVKRYKDPFDEIIVVEGKLTEDAKSILQHVAKKIVPAAMAAGMAVAGAGGAHAQGGANPHYPGLDRSVGQHISDIFSPNYKENMRQREFEKETRRQEHDAHQHEIRKARVHAARQAGMAATGASAVKIYDQARMSQDGRSIILYDMENRVVRISAERAEFMVGDSQRLPHYVVGGSVYYVRHPHTSGTGAMREEIGTIGTVGTIPASGVGKTQFTKTGSTTAAKFNDKGQLTLDKDDLDDEAIDALQKAGVEIKENAEFDAILDAYPEAVKGFQNGEDLSDYPDFYDALFDYYFESGEMPYGTAKARDGDPIEWISDRLDRVLGQAPMEAKIDLDDIDLDDATANDQAGADQNIVMQIRKASDYEKPTTLSLSDGEVTIDSVTAKKILSLFNGIRPQSKPMMQQLLGTSKGFNEILDHVKSMKEAVAEGTHNQEHGSPYDRSSADAWYHRKENPHKGGVGGDSGQRSENLTPEEIAAYHAGYKAMYDQEGPNGGKQYEGVQPVTEKLRLVASHGTGTKTAKVYRDEEWQEFRVKFYTDGKHEGEDADYHTDSKDDANDTAKHEVERGWGTAKESYYCRLSKERKLIPEGYKKTNKGYIERIRGAN